MVRLVKMWLLAQFLIIIAQAQPQNIELKNLEQLLKERSPRFKNLQLEYEFGLKEVAESFAWDDPEFEFEQEKLSDATDGETERSYRIQQNIVMPWVLRGQGKVRRARERVANMAYEQAINELVGEMKSGYLRIKLMSEDLLQLAEISESLENISRIARHQSGEGAISGLDAALIRMATVNIRKEYLELERERNALAAAWAIDAGITPEDALGFTGDMPPSTFDYSRRDLRNMAAESSLPLKIEAEKTLVRRREVGLEEGKFLPHLGLSAGYKKVNSDFDGYIVGLSLPIPLWNRNRLNTQKARIHGKIQENRQSIASARIHAKIENLHKAVHETGRLRGYVDNELVSGAADFNKAIAAYREGWIRLNDLLDAAEIFASFIRTKSELTQNYFNAIFELETLVGRPLIQY